MLSDGRMGLSTAPAGGNTKRNPPMSFNSDESPDERPLALTNGGFNDDPIEH